MEDSFSEVAALIGDKARAKMLWSLLDGRAYTATELAIFANISRQSCSNHLSKLVKAAILKVEKQGRHRYYCFANDKIAQIIEGIAYLLPTQTNIPVRAEHKPKGIKYARTCYDHLAGKVGVALTVSLLNMGIINKEEDTFFVTKEGENWFGGLGIKTNLLLKKKRKFAYPCLDWSERKSHIGGALGAALLNAMLENDWIRRKKDSRAVIITYKGAIALKKRFNVEID